MDVVAAMEYVRCVLHCVILRHILFLHVGPTVNQLPHPQDCKVR